ncbi:rab-GTPase-TBC domain-containing protein [Lipomyces orientalis]|uniref:Rab-GTPase-TBC domain-containing protein n=1 Tax=Lipomyces orientalis TaxID=1233043 RepID=A0ACC3TR87_9ASCO
MESMEDNSPESLVTVSLSDASSVASFVPETLSDSAPSTAHSSIGTSLGSAEFPIDQSLDDESETVNWNELERTECQESRESASDESTAYLLARLERENARFELDPKALPSSALPRRRRPVSVEKLRKIVEKQNSLRISMVPNAPQLTDLEFWAVLVADYPRTAGKLPCLLSKKIKGGVPPPLRGLVWQSMAGASDSTLESLFNALIAEPSPYDKVIGRDLHRTFPDVEMFRERGGQGQKMLAQVLRAFSLYDMQVGYCQGLAFLVGPLLMHMDERSAFCVLVRLMEEYDLRTMFTADMAGLHLRIFQFTQLLKKFVPAVDEHMEKLGVQSIYATQWFLSFFAVTCPLNMLLRIYDVIFAEGALETLMRVAIAVMQANEERILMLKEEDEVLQLLLGRSLWQVYEGNADVLISDAMSLTTVATRDVLEDLENLYKSRREAAAEAAQQVLDSPTKSMSIQTSELQAAATRFLGRIWANVGSNSPAHMTPTNSMPGRTLRRTGSRASLTSTINSLELDDGSQFFRQSDQKQNVELHNQIEDLVIALSTLQKQHISAVEELEVERRAREEERSVFQSFLSNLPDDNVNPEVSSSIAHMKEKFGHQTATSQRLMTFKDLIKQLETSQAATLMEKERNGFLKRDLDCKCVEVRDLKDQLFEIKSRYQDVLREKSKLERTLNEVRQRQTPREDLPSDYEYYDLPSSPAVSSSPARPAPAAHGLRELRLGRQNQLRGQSSFNKRSSSLFVPEDITETLNSPSTPNPSLLQPASPPSVGYSCDSCDALRMELATSKTSEAVALQELEETKNKFERLKRSVPGGANPRPPITHYATALSKLESAPGSTGGDGQASAWPKIGKFGWTR